MEWTLRGLATGRETTHKTFKNLGRLLFSGGRIGYLGACDVERPRKWGSGKGTLEQAVKKAARMLRG